MDVNENVRHCDVGLATGGALNLVCLINHTCFGSVCVFIHCESHILMEKGMRGPAYSAHDISPSHLFN